VREFYPALRLCGQETGAARPAKASASTRGLHSKAADAIRCLAAGHVRAKIGRIKPEKGQLEPHPSKSHGRQGFVPLAP